MLLTQKTLVEGSRMLAAYCGRQLDLEHGHPDAAARKAAGKRAALLIPIVKSFFTDMGQEVASLGVQVYGGHGYIREWGMEQLMRDSRITQIYEGTNGIQALDLIRRKLMGDGGAELHALQDELAAMAEARPAAASWRNWPVPCWRASRNGATSPPPCSTARATTPGNRRLLGGLPPVLVLCVVGRALAAGRRPRPGRLGWRHRRGGFLPGQAAQRALLRAPPAARASGHRESLLGGADCLMALPEAHFAF